MEFELFPNELLELLPNELPELFPNELELLPKLLDCPKGLLLALPGCVPFCPGCIPFCDPNPCSCGWFGVVIKPARGSFIGSYKNCHSLYFFFLLYSRMVLSLTTLATPTIGPLATGC